MTGGSPTYSEKHPHEPEIPPALDADGRCLVCGLELRAEQAEVRLREYEEALKRYENEAPEWLKPIARAVLAASGGREAQ